MRRVLVLEKDQDTAERLTSALKQNGDLTVSTVPTMRQACILVAQQPQDLAFIPMEEADQLIHSLRAIQSDLKMILTTADPQAQFAPQDKESFQGMVHTGALETELPPLLNESDDSSEQMPATLITEPVWRPGLARFQDACQEAGLFADNSPAQMAVLASAEQLIGFSGRGNETQAQAVVELVKQSWQKGQFTAQLQYLQLPDYYDARLIYSRAISGTVLSLVAEPDTSVTDLRRLADQLAQRLSGPREVSNESTTSRFNALTKSNGIAHEEKTPSATFAIAWRPVKPLPILLQNVVQDCVSTLADENGCQVHHLSVMPTMVHLVIECPLGKTAAWAVFFLKSGINNEIQQQFGVQSSIWRKGFYATESEQPLNEAELNLLLAP
ncbi:MAG: transposase [Candidatus Promineifilaceae bacterium]